MLSVLANCMGILFCPVMNMLQKHKLDIILLKIKSVNIIYRYYASGIKMQRTDLFGTSLYFKTALDKIRRNGPFNDQIGENYC